MSIESTILGEIICKPGGFNEAIAAGITADAFDGHANRAIFAGLERLKYEGSSVDEIGLIDLWTRDKDAMQGHGFSRLNSVLVEVTSDGNKAHYADFSRHLSILIEDWKRRRLIKAIGKASRMAEDSPEDAAAIVDAISKENAVLGAQKAFANDGTIDRVMQRTEQLIAGQQPASRISIPLVKWDSAFGAIESHELVIIAARPSVGKSSLMVQAAGRTLAKVPDSVIVLFTLEVDEEAVLLQMAAQLAKVDRRNLHREPRNKIEDLRAALERFRAILGNRLFISRETSLAGMESKLAQVQAKSGRIDWIGIDYLQLSRVSNSSNRNRAEQVAEISRTMKEWTARDKFAAPVIALSQLNRESEKDKRPPMLSDLRESGAIEQDADRVVFVHRPTEDAAGNAQDNQPCQDYILIQAKMRNGPTGILPAKFHRALTTYDDR